MKHPRSTPQCRYTHRRGIATLWLVMTIILLVAFVALAVDVGWVVLVGHQLGSGADASSLAGAMEVRRSISGARDQAVAYAANNAAAGAAIQVARNDANAAGGDVVVGYFSRDSRTFSTSPPTGLLPNAVHVNARRIDGSLGGPIDSIFASIFGYNEWNVQRDAIAMIHGDLGPAVLALNPSASCSLDMRGNTSLQVLAGAIVVDSSHNNAACHSGQPDLTTDELHIVGGTDNNWGQVDMTGDLYTGADPVPDPLADLPAPNEPAAAPPSTLVGNVTTYYPGTYNSLPITNGTHVFQPGLYYFKGEFKYNGGSVDATGGVMLFFAGPNGRLDVAGNGSFRIAGMSPTAYPNGPAVPASVANIPVPIYQARGNTRPMTLNGTSNWQIDGTVYAPNAALDIEGTPGTFANGLIADKIEINGNQTLVIDFEDQFPRIPRRVFLVK